MGADVELGVEDVVGPVGVPNENVGFDVSFDDVAGVPKAVVLDVAGVAPKAKLPPNFGVDEVFGAAVVPDTGAVDEGAAAGAEDPNAEKPVVFAGMVKLNFGPVDADAWVAAAPASSFFASLAAGLGCAVVSFVDEVAKESGEAAAGVGAKPPSRLNKDPPEAPDVVVELGVVDTAGVVCAG